MSLIYYSVTAKHFPVHIFLFPNAKSGQEIQKKEGIDQFVETIICVLFFCKVETQMCKQEDDTINTMGMWS